MIMFHSGIILAQLVVFHYIYAWAKCDTQLNPGAGGAGESNCIHDSLHCFQQAWLNLRIEFKAPLVLDNSSIYLLLWHRPPTKWMNRPWLGPFKHSRTGGGSAMEATCGPFDYPLNLAQFGPCVQCEVFYGVVKQNSFTLLYSDVHLRLVGAPSLLT